MSDQDPAVPATARISPATWNALRWGPLSFAKSAGEESSLLGMRLVLDETMPEDQIELRDENGECVARIVGLDR